MNEATYRLKDAARTAAQIGAFIAAVTFARVVFAFVAGKAPALYLVESPVLGFGIFFAAAFILQITGAVRRNGRQLLVNPWFAWMTIGAFVVFIVTLLILGHPVIMPPHVVEWSAVAAAGWVGAVGLVWVVAKATGYRRAAPVTGGSPLLGVDLAHSPARTQRSEDKFVGGGLLLMALIAVGIAVGMPGPWTSVQTEFVLVGVAAAWLGITKFARASRA